MAVLFDNCEQHFESYVLDTQNPLKGALNKLNGLNTSKNQLVKFFLGFRDFEYALRQKTKTWKRREKAATVNDLMLLENC